MQLTINGTEACVETVVAISEESQTHAIPTASL
jgi:hypothetical protein